MKISIAYRPDDAGEAKQVDIIRAFLKRFLPGAKVRVSHRYDPHSHIYLATKKPKSLVIPGKMLDHRPPLCYTNSRLRHGSTAARLA